MNHILVKDIMTAEPITANDTTSLAEASKKMREIECGILPVVNGDDLVGVITDRDIVTRAVARGVDPSSANLQTFMSMPVYTCQEDDSTEKALDLMTERNVGRLVVLDKNSKISGIITLGSIARHTLGREGFKEALNEAIELPEIK